MTTSKNYILTKEVAEKKLRRIAFEILESNMDEKEIILAGVKMNGVVVAKVLQSNLAAISGLKTELIEVSLDKKNPGDVLLDKQIDFNNKVIILIDDVLNSGKTLLYALKPFLDSHPKSIQTMVLVERTHTSFPVHPNYVGISLATTMQDHIYVEVEGNTITGAYLE